MKRTPLLRKTPLRNKNGQFAKRLKPRNDTKAKERKLHQAVLERDEGVCKMLRWSSSAWLGVEGSGWFLCGRPASDASHVIGRTKLSNAAKYNADSCIASCRECHDAYHSGNKLVTFPQTAIDRAQQNAKENS